MKIFQKGFNYSQDGPGNRLVYHMQGCNMHCRWCSNPEGMNLTDGTEVSVDEILDECKRSKMMFFDGGGVTFTGGEATVQFNELSVILKQLKSNQIHTVIETNGTHPDLPQLFEYIDFLIMDFKHYDSDILRKYTGVGNQTVRSNFEKIANTHRQTLVRIPIINEFNSDPTGFVEFFSKFDTSNICFEFLPYHEYGREKWVSEYQIKDGYISEDTLKQFQDEFQNNNLYVVRT